MALGKKNVNPGIGNGMAPQPPTASPEKLDAFLDAVGTRLNQLQATVADLVERTAADAHHPAAVPAMDMMGGFAPPVHSDSDVEAASRTLVLAQRTADTLLAEAREEAANLVSEAQTLRDTMLSEARAAADAELGVQRSRLVAEQSRWEQLKADLSSGFTTLDDQIENYVATLTGSHAAVKEVLRGFDIPAEIIIDDVIASDELAMPSEFPAPPSDGWEAPVATEVAADTYPIDEPGLEGAESVNSMFGPRSTPLFSGQPTGWNNEGGEAAAPPVPADPPVPEGPPAPTRRPGFFGQ